MKRFFSLLCYLCSLHVVHAQIAFFDAQDLQRLHVGTVVDPAGYLVLPENAAVYPLLKAYSNGAATEGEIKDAFAGNPFMRFAPGAHGANAVNAPAAVAAENPIFAALGGLPVTNIANGIAQFMIKRAKEELTISFFDRFKQFVDKHEEFKILFPKTVDALENLLSYQYTTMLSHLQTAFMADLSNLYSNIPTFLALPQYQAFFNRFPEVSLAIRTLGLIQSVAYGNTLPADALVNFANASDLNNPVISQGFKDFGNAVNLAVIFSESVRDNSPDEDRRNWISLPTFLSNAQDPIFLQIYLGLVYQKIVEKNIAFNNHPFAPVFAGLNGPTGPLALMRAEMTQFLQLAQQVDSLIVDIRTKKAAGTTLTDQDYSNYISTGIDVIEFSFDIARFFKSDFDVHPYTRLARDGNAIYLDIYKKTYPQAVTSSMDFISDLFTLIQANQPAGQAILTDVKAALNTTTNTITASSLDKLGKGEYKAIQAAIAAAALPDNQLNALRAAVQYKSFVKLNKVIETIKTYGLFMANLATATSADEVENIVENAALPVGSSSIKKYSKWNISVQSYLGASFRIDNPNKAFHTAWSDRLGVYGPIGISFNYGLKKGGSIGLMASLFDLGAIIDYQLKIDSTVSNNGTNTQTVNKNYQVKLGQIVSPGFHFVYGFFDNLPITFGAGAQYGPGLGKIDNAGSPVITNPSWRYNVFLAVDIPFFNILTVKYKTN